jgi:hypothetical protein
VIRRREDLDDVAAPDGDADLRAAVGEVAAALADLRAVTGDEAIQLSARLRAMESRLDELADQLTNASGGEAGRPKSEYSREEIQALRAAKADAGSDKPGKGKSGT